MNNTVDTIQCKRCGSYNSKEQECCNSCGRKLNVSYGYLVASIIMFIFLLINIVIFFFSNMITEGSKGATDNGYAGLVHLLFLPFKYGSLLLIFVFLILGIVLLVKHINKNSSK